MAGPSASVEVYVLAAHPPAEAFARLSLFSREHGGFTAFQRHSRKVNNANPPRDLFDRAQMLLEAAPQGDAWFVRENQLLGRHPDIARSYDHLVFASAFAQCLVRNPVAPESRSRVWTLLGQSLDSFSRHDRADLTYFKALYSFVRDEGYPLRQQWMASLTTADQTLAMEVLKNPVEGQLTPKEDVRRILIRFEQYLRAETEFVLPAPTTTPA